MKPPEMFKTERLVLRKPRLEDAPDIFQGYATDPDVTRYLAWKPNHVVEETRQFLERCLAGWNQEKFFTWAITFPREDRCFGMVEIRLDRFMAEVGYVLAKSWWGKGIITEAVRPVVDWALFQPEIFRVWAVCDLENPASARVMEKLGMQKEGILRRWNLHPNRSDEPRDCLCYSIL